MFFRFQSVEVNVIYDKRTRLYWHRPSVNVYNYDQIPLYLEHINKRSAFRWRLPVLAELDTIIVYNCYGMFKNKIKSFEIYGSYLWSSSEVDEPIKRLIMLKSWAGTCVRVPAYEARVMAVYGGD